MKYITFNSACSYAGVANMLAQFGVDTDDRTIALDMGLPFLFSRENGGFAAGPMLQSARWFNLYLHPLGFHMEECLLPAAQVPDYLTHAGTAMLGIRVGNTGKHALTYVGRSEKGLRFLNNKWQQEDAPEELFLSDQELVEKIDESCMVATLHAIPPTAVDLCGELVRSIAALEDNLLEVEKAITVPQAVAALRSQMNTLFRPLLLDGITMLNLLEEADLSRRFTAIQRAFLTALQKESPVLRLAEHIPLEDLRTAVAEYRNLIRQELNRRKDENHAV